MDKSGLCLLERINNNKHEKDELFRERLLQEAEQFIVAGSETTGHTLAVTTFYILQDKDVQEKLRQELINADIVFDGNLEITKLQALPYLVTIPSAIVESMSEKLSDISLQCSPQSLLKGCGRIILMLNMQVIICNLLTNVFSSFSHGVGSRLPRINRSSQVQYKQWKIPAGVCAKSSPNNICHIRR